VFQLFTCYDVHSKYNGWESKCNSYDACVCVCVCVRGEFSPRQTRQLPRAVDLKGRLLSCQSY